MEDHDLLSKYVTCNLKGANQKGVVILKDNAQNVKKRDNIPSEIKGINFDLRLKTVSISMPTAYQQPPILQETTAPNLLLRTILRKIISWKLYTRAITLSMIKMNSHFNTMMPTNRQRF